MRSADASWKARADAMRSRTLGVILIAAGLLGLAAASLVSVMTGDRWSAPGWAGASFRGQRGVPAWPGPELPGQAVDVILTDGGAMMCRGMMRGTGMQATVRPAAVASGDVSLRVWNAGSISHEVLVLPLPASGAGTRPIGADGRVDEAGSLGEAARSWGEGEGEGIAPGVVGWLTLRLAAGRYELLCNLPGHYRAGMFVELAVQ